MSDMWDVRWLRLAREIGSWSKDPSTKVGAIIVRPDNTQVSAGYNGFPRGIADTEERLNDRSKKYPLTIHGEMNALHFAREDLEGCTLYTYPLLPCEHCAIHIIQRGIKRVVAVSADGELEDRWKASNNAAIALFEEAGVAVTTYKEEKINESLR